MPVNFTTQLHEVGDPKVFLAAFASAFQGSAGTLSTGLTNLITPTGQAAAKQTHHTPIALWNPYAQKRLRRIGSAPQLLPQNPDPLFQPRCSRS